MLFAGCKLVGCRGVHGPAGGSCGRPGPPGATTIGAVRSLISTLLCVTNTMRTTKDQ